MNLRDLFYAGLLVVIAGCATNTPAPVSDRSHMPSGTAPEPVAKKSGQKSVTPPVDGSTHTVKSGETLATIALEYGLDYRELAGWNSIENVDRILVGQVLRLTPPKEGISAAGDGVVISPLKNSTIRTDTDTAKSGAIPPTKTGPKAILLPYSEANVTAIERLNKSVTAATSTPPKPAAAIATASPAAQDSSPKSDNVTNVDEDKTPDWIWPVKGKILSGFKEDAPLKGLDIAGKAGQIVVAAAAGKVIYAGSGLRGYGKLVVIKHNKTYFSTYAHNRAILVDEGQSVARGQKIAEMGDTDSDSVKLHFQVRKNGKPIDPMKVLPAN